MSSPADSDALLALEIRGLSKSFGDFRALSDIDLDVRKGEFVCFLGPSGCGKTTLLRAIAGLDPQDEGTIHQNGRDITRAPVAGRDFGIVFQSYALFPNLTVARNIGYGLRGTGMNRSARQERVNELLDLVNLTGQERKYPSQISGGQQQRVALARALAPAPQLLLLDEPLSALDAQVRLHLREQLRQLQQELGVTTIMVTHDQDEALSLADRIVVMNHGVIEQVGTPEEVFLKPASPFVAGFLGDMNFLAGIMRAGGTLEVTASSGAQPAVTFAAPGTSLPAEGSRLRLGIRPSDIGVNPSTAAGPDGIGAVIETVFFRGNNHVLVVNSPALGGTLNVELTRDAWHDLRLQRGAPVSLSILAERLHIFPEP